MNSKLTIAERNEPMWVTIGRLNITTDERSFLLLQKLKKDIEKLQDNIIGLGGNLKQHGL